MSEKSTELSSSNYKETCLGCGRCCTDVFIAISHKDEFSKGCRMYKILDEFPYKQKEDGYCEMYEDGKCKVYDNRPLLCDSKKQLHLLDPEEKLIDRRKYYELQEELCRNRSKSSTKGSKE